MRKILISAAGLVFAGTMLVSATGAFFSDTETSTGNVFTAGAIDLKVDSTQHYNNAVCVPNVETVGFHWALAPQQVAAVDQYPVIGSSCDGTWSLTDLGPANHFFNFGDVKPGDQGEDTVSLHIDNNPAYACADIGTNANNENTLTDPEIKAGDTSSTTGELAQNIHLFAWLDNASTSGAVAGDNIWQAGETALAGPIAMSALNGTTTLTLADGTSAPLPGGSTNYIGMAWCAGTMTAVNGVITCDGSTMGNDAQTDSAMATIQFRVIQSRNNSSFRCGASTAPANVVVTADSLATTLVGVASTSKWYFYDDTNDVLNNALGSFGAGPGTPPLGTGSAHVTLADGTSRVFLATSQYGNIPLSNLTQLAFTEYSTSGVGGANEAPFFRFNVDFTAGSPTFQKSLVYVPADNGSVAKDTWQTWDMIAGGNAKWEYSGAFWPAGVSTVANTVPGTTARTLTSILADYPLIRTWAAGAQLGMRVGEPGPASYNGNLDSFTIATGGTPTTYDFGN